MSKCSLTPNIQFIGENVPLCEMGVTGFGVIWNPASQKVQRKLSWRGKTYSYPHPNFKGNGYTTEINKARKLIYAKIIMKKSFFS